MLPSGLAIRCDDCDVCYGGRSWALGVIRWFVSHVASRVATAAGVLAGVTDGGVVTFKGVPYGASTAGSNRFRPPQPVEAWDGVLDASFYRDACPQPPIVGELAPEVERLIDYVLVAGDRFGENCLSVNVWTPAVDDARRPVMVWFHGGSQTVGSGNMPIYDGANLARRGAPSW